MTRAVHLAHLNGKHGLILQRVVQATQLRSVHSTKGLTRLSRIGLTGGYLQTKVKAAHRFAVDGTHGEEFHCEPTGKLPTRDGRGAEVVGPDLCAQPEYCPVLDLARGLDS